MFMVIASLEVALEMKKKALHPQPLGATTQFQKKNLKMYEQKKSLEENKNYWPYKLPPWG